MSKRAALLLAALAVACTNTSPAPPAVRLVPDIRYIKDERTGICFAAVQSRTYYGYNVVSLATVPCESVGTLLNAEP